MNIIGNSCIASYITRDCLQQQFENPFTWCIMDYTSCYNLVKYYSKINYLNFKLCSNGLTNFSIIVDGLVTIQYVHYHFDAKCNTPTIINNDVYYNKIWEYIISKYVSRVNRMLSYQHDPIFIFATANYGLARHIPFTYDQQTELDNLNSPYPIVISFGNMVTNSRLHVIPQTTAYIDNGLNISKYIFSELRKRSLL